MSSLFERLGGAEAVDAAVDIFYGKVLADPRISGFFENVDMRTQARKQKAFLTVAFGGPNNYTGKNMRRAHEKMDLNDTHFDAVVEHLGATLKELGAADSDIQEVAAIAETTRDDVLNR